MPLDYKYRKQFDEQPGYFAVAGGHLYTVLHRVNSPVARVLLVGPFASDRHYSYVPWVQWARYLAARGVEVLRYDYRGIGESEGVFEDLSFEEWGQDVKLLADWLIAQSPTTPLLLHGLDVGALLAARVFDGGSGDLLLMWAPPPTANHSLRSSLLRWFALEQISRRGDERKPPSSYIASLENGFPVEVAGYQWSSKLWLDSFNVSLPPGMGGDTSARSSYKKPVRMVSLGKEASPLVKAGFLVDERTKDFGAFFAENWAWIETSVDQEQGAYQ